MNLTVYAFAAAMAAMGLAVTMMGLQLPFTLSGKSCYSGWYKAACNTVIVLGISLFILAIAYLICLIWFQCGKETASVFAGAGTGDGGLMDMLAIVPLREEDFYFYLFALVCCMIGVLLVPVGLFVHWYAEGECYSATDYAPFIWGAGVGTTILSAAMVWITVVWSALPMTGQAIQTAAQYMPQASEFFA